jgi:hypothetical protein
MTTARFTEVNRAVDRLHGILVGISSDYKLEDTEISKLFKWVNVNESLHHLEPFKSVVALLTRCLKDGIIDEDEREEILDWCLEFHDGLPECVTSAIRRLHGVLHGISIDKKATEEELKGLRDWLMDYEIFHDYWPFDTTWNLVNYILEDGIVTKEEETEFLEFCNNFTECVIDDPKVHDELYNRSFMQSDAFFLQPFTALCDRESNIEFRGKAFCFTGPARIGPRRKLKEIVKSLEGIPYDSVIQNLDYLVIGAQSSPAWAYSTYGRKIERVIELRDKGNEISILHEDDFISQAGRFLPDLGS